MDVEKPKDMEITEVGATKIKKRDKWDKWNIVLKPVGGFITGIAIVALGIISSDYLEGRQANEMRIRLYTELITNREEAESALRKDMFTLIIKPFLKPESPVTHEESVLNLELLAYNFHESFNLKPLFIHHKKKVNEDATLKKKNKKEYLDRLDKVAREITRKQMAVLESAGEIFEKRINLDSLRNMPEGKGITLEVESRTLDEVKRQFEIKALEVDSIAKEIKIRLEIRTTYKDSTEKLIEADFWVGFFDFPMINNTRLSHDQRCGIVLNIFEEQRAEITLLYFPGSHASLKEKPYYQEVIDNLLPSSSKKK